MIFRRQQPRKRGWEKVLHDCAVAWNRPLQKRVFWSRHSLTVPPDDLIHIDIVERMVSQVRFEGRLLLTARWPGRWQDAVMVEARKKPRVLYTFGKLPKAIDDPGRPWIVRSKDSTLARALISPDLVRMIDEVWSPRSWMTVWERKGEVQVFVGERQTSSSASTERMHQLIAIMRALIAGARTLTSE